MWDMPLMKDKAGKEGFLYDRLRAGQENVGKDSGADSGETEKGKEGSSSTKIGDAILGFSKTNQRPRARSL